ncbi:MAG: MurR/RpiR family transcriptional regulator [Lachnospiraceae bacterium]|nr:MurR/RpiR family transcriptional regulator [Lachnospiraceae bacterium]MDY5742569.1 MurR/RpiR family transcriptional regulator [Lachnospiraceae bacterium]
MKHSSGIIVQIQTAYHRLTKTEKKVADYVLAHPSEVLYMSITELADVCEVGETSVYRFCRTLQLQGYQEFKMKLSLGMDEADMEEVTETAEENSLLTEVRDVHINAITQSSLLLQAEAVEAMIDEMERARRVIFVGVGDSQLTAKEARNKFLRVTRHVTCFSDPHMQAMAASLTGPEDLVIFISFSGATKDNIYVAKEAKRAGARIGCITHFKKSPLTNYADVTLLSGGEDTPLENGSLAVKIGQLYVIDVLFRAYYQRNYRQCRENSKKTTGAVVEKLF